MRLKPEPLHGPSTRPGCTRAPLGRQGERASANDSSAEIDGSRQSTLDGRSSRKHTRWPPPRGCFAQPSAAWATSCWAAASPAAPEPMASRARSAGRGASGLAEQCRSRRTSVTQQAPQTSLISCAWRRCGAQTSGRGLSGADDYSPPGCPKDHPDTSDSRPRQCSPAVDREPPSGTSIRASLRWM
jgi:hypothetical protein